MSHWIACCKPRPKGHNSFGNVTNAVHHIGKRARCKPKSEGHFATDATTCIATSAPTRSTGSARLGSRGRWFCYSMSLPDSSPGSGSNSSNGKSNEDSRPLGMLSTPRRNRRATTSSVLPVPLQNPVLKAALPVEGQLVPLPWMSELAILLEDLIAFARERREPYFSRLQSTSFLSFVEMSQVLLAYAKTPQTAQHIKSSSSCYLIFLIGEHGAGKQHLIRPQWSLYFGIFQGFCARRRGIDKSEKDVPEQYQELWDTCPTSFQVQTATAKRKDLHTDVNNGFATAGPVVQHRMTENMIKTSLEQQKRVALLRRMVGRICEKWILFALQAIF
jgi:hypothetical protein